MTGVYEVIKSNPNLAQKVIDYFLSEAIDSSSHEEIRQLGMERIKPNNDQTNDFIKLGYLSIVDFEFYMLKTNQIGEGIKPKFVEIIVNALERGNIIFSLPDHIVNFKEKRYRPIPEYARHLYENELILNVICGWNHLIDKYSGSVMKIEHKDKMGDFSIGTGFYMQYKNESTITPVIVTNKHVVEGASQIKLFSHNDTEIPILSISTDEHRDIAFIILKNKLEAPTFQFSSDIEILSEIITIGYPSVPMLNNSYQIYHKGEVNSFVEYYNGNQLFLFSAKTSSGNSGSPILNASGMMIGMITEELFEKEQFYNKGKLPYYVGIPSSEIYSAAKKYRFVK